MLVPSSTMPSPATFNDVRSMNTAGLGFPSVNAATRNPLPVNSAVPIGVKPLLDVLSTTGNPDRDAQLAVLSRQASQVLETTRRSFGGVFAAAWRGGLYGASIGGFVGLLRLALPSTMKTLWEGLKKMIGRAPSPNYNFSVRGALILTGLLTVLGGIIGASAQGYKRTGQAFADFSDLDISLK